MKAIEAANPGVDSTKLKLGQKINIPAAAPKPVKTNGTKGDAAAATDAGGTYTVKSGDNLGSIAKLHGTTVAKLREANGLKTDQIKVGQKLKVPAGGVKKSNEPSAGAVPAPKGMPCWHRPCRCRLRANRPRRLLASSELILPKTNHPNHRCTG